jgi:hypothetical protein
MLKLVTSMYCLTETMLADILTKEVPNAKHIWCVYNFGHKLKFERFTLVGVGI